MIVWAQWRRACKVDRGTSYSLAAFRIEEMVLARIARRAIWIRLSWSISNLLCQEGGYSEEKLAKNLCVVVMGNMVGHFVEILVEDDQGGAMARVVLA